MKVSASMSERDPSFGEVRSLEPVPLAEALDPARVGHKVASLAALVRAGHRVPDGFVIPAGARASRSSLGEALARLGPGPYAVRSSGVSEDSAEASFAGQFESVLDVKTFDEVIVAVDQVLASAHSVHVVAYRAHARRQGASASLGVLVQRMVAAERAGVMFTANPVTGDDEVVIEAVRGLGDRLVSGEADGERWVERGGAMLAPVEAEVLDEALARRLAELARRIAAERRSPQDIEWAAAGDEIFVLQARPITGLPVPPKIEIPPGRWAKDTGHFGGPMTPVGASIILPVYEQAIASGVCQEFGMPLETIRQRSFGGEVYTQDVELGGKHNPAAPPPWWVLGIVCRLVPSLRRRLKVAAESLPKLHAYPEAWERTWRNECRDRILEARAIDLGALDDPALLVELDRLVKQVLLPHMELHFRLAVPYVVAVYELSRVCEELLGWKPEQTLDLLGGSSVASSAPARDMAAIAAGVPEEALSGGLAALRESPVADRLEAWLSWWGLRTIDTDPGAPMITEREDLILELLRVARDTSAGVDERRKQAIRAVRDRLRGSDLERFDRALAYAEWVYPMREDNAAYTEGLPCGLVRRALVEVGRRLAAAGTLEKAEDVVYLELEELRPALLGGVVGESCAARARRRRAERAWVLAHPGPIVHGPLPVPPPDTRGFPKNTRRIIDPMMWAIEQELMPPKIHAEDASALAGVAASPGRYTGPVRVILDEADLDRLRPGDVLVSRTTHSTWAVVFARAGALVTDGGGLLAHPAIIAREHDIPAVLATGRATSCLRDGQIVTVDGHQGKVFLQQPRSK
jgi:rifampicin phosphotransferase